MEVPGKYQFTSFKKTSFLSLGLKGKPSKVLNFYLPSLGKITPQRHKALSKSYLNFTFLIFLRHKRKAKRVQNICPVIYPIIFWYGNTKHKLGSYLELVKVRWNLLLHKKFRRLHSGSFEERVCKEMDELVA